MTVRVFNTLTRAVETLEPLSPPQVGIYCCGPTVYNYQHIGNLRTYIFEDVLVRVLRYAGYQVRHVMNITDVGHLVSDADEGEDKMLVAAKREGKSSQQIAQFYTGVFFEHCSWLNIQRPDVICKATEHVGQMIALIERMIARGYAYESGGNVYCDVSKYPDYGKLAQLNLRDLKAGARIEVDSQKKNPLDFALWFTNSKFENQELQWDSPWGRGYPGWHIECSAMSMKYLGEQFDIHCGGIDHIPVHHTNEIAQAEGATGKMPARYWLHGGFLVVPSTTGAQKMAKSSGEFLTLDLLKERGFDPISYRLFCLGGTYRNELFWSWQALDGAANQLRNLRSAVYDLRTATTEEELTTKEQLSAKGKEALLAFEEQIFNDLALPRALSVVHALLSDKMVAAAEKLYLLEAFDTVLGLGIKEWEEEKVDIPAAIEALAKERAAARGRRDFQEADRLRKEIAALGFSVEDSKDGYTIKKA